MTIEQALLSREKFVNPNSYIYHYGVLGMKWGVRKDEYDFAGGRKQKIDSSKFTTVSGTAEHVSSANGFNIKNLAKNTPLYVTLNNPKEHDMYTLMYSTQNVLLSGSNRDVDRASVLGDQIDAYKGTTGTREKAKKQLAENIEKNDTFTTKSTKVKDLKVADDDAFVDAWLKTFKSDKEYNDYIFSKGVKKADGSYDDDDVDYENLKGQSKLREYASLKNQALANLAEYGYKTHDEKKQDKRISQTFDILKKAGADAIRDNNEIWDGTGKPNGSIIILDQQATTKKKSDGWVSGKTRINSKTIFDETGGDITKYNKAISKKISEATGVKNYDVTKHYTRYADYQYFVDDLIYERSETNKMMKKKVG